MTPRPDTDLRATLDIVSSVREAWQIYEATESYRANPVLRAAVGGDGGRPSDTPDPVHAIVASFADYEETCTMVHALMADARMLQRRIFNVLTEAPDLAQTALANMKSWRCSGLWNPTCTRLADHDRGKYKGWCDACVRGQQRENQAKENGNVTPMSPTVALHVLPSARVEASTLKQVGASSTAWVTCTQCPAVGGELARFDVPAGLDPQVWLDRHRISEHSA